MTIRTVAVIGPGKVGGDLGSQLARSGVQVIFGVRGGKDLAKLAGPNVAFASPPEAAAKADAIVLALPANVVVEVARGLGDLGGKILIDANNCLKMDHGPVWNPPPEGSLAQALAAAVPSARVVKAFNTFGHEYHGDPRTAAGPVTVPIAGDDAEAKADVAELARTGGFAPVDCGPLRNAGLLENVAILWIHLAIAGGHGREIAWQLVGRPAG